MPKNLIDFTDLEIARAVHSMDGHSDSLEGAELRMWTKMKELIISNCEINRELDVDNRVSTIMDLTTDAYMRGGSYGESAWEQAIRELIGAGYSDENVVSIMKSKVTRWADDYEMTPLAYIQKHCGDPYLRRHEIIK